MRIKLSSRQGSAPILFIGLCFALLAFTYLLLEVGAAYERYDYAMDIMQRACNSAVEANMRDEYRKDKILKLNTSGAKTSVKAFISADMPDSYTVTITEITATATPPTMTVKGKITFPTLFSQYGNTTLSFDFKVRATNYDLH